MKGLISFDNTLVPYTTGMYFLKAFNEIAEMTFCLPQALDNIRSEYDFYIKIDDGVSAHKWRKDLKPAAYYVIDSHIEDEEGWREQTIRDGEFLWLFVAQKNAIKKYNNLAKTMWIPLAADPEKHYWQYDCEKVYDLTFIGNFHSQYVDNRIDCVDAAFKTVFDRREYRRGQPCCYWGNRSMLEMAMKFRQSRIVFNHALNNDINMRYFEACMSGGFQLASRIKDNGFEDLFEEDTHMACYSDEEEMRDKINYYLDNPAEREAIALAGKTHVLEAHTYGHRAREMMAIIEEEK